MAGKKNSSNTNKTQNHINTGRQQDPAFQRFMVVAIGSITTRSSSSDETEQSGFEYAHKLWGELIYGTKAQIQALGIAVDRAFPGEVDGPKRTLTVVDPRGFPTQIKICDYKGEGIYSARISFPDREQPWRQWEDFAPGVRRDRCSAWQDEYLGTADALVAAGLVSKEQLPGQPGMRKVHVSIRADGTLLDTATRAPCSDARDQGEKLIERASKTTYRVKVRTGQEERNRRWAKYEAAELEREARLRAMPRPEPLI